MNQMNCPKCGNIAYLKNTGRKVGTVAGATVVGVSAATGSAAVGAVVGTAAVGTAAAGTAAAGTAVGLKAGALAGTWLGPVGMIAGAGIGAILGLLVGAGKGASQGYKVGKVIDEKVIGEYACPHCGHTFTN